MSEVLTNPDILRRYVFLADRTGNDILPVNKRTGRSLTKNKYGKYRFQFKAEDGHYTQIEVSQYNLTQDYKTIYNHWLKEKIESKP